MRHQWLYLMLLPITSAYAAPPIAITAEDIENGLDPKPQMKIVLEPGARGPSEIVIDTRSYAVESVTR